MSSKWRNIWRVLAAGELIGFMASGLLASVQFAALHVTWVYLVAHPDLLLQSGVSFVTDALIALVLCAALLLTVPIVVVGEIVAMRASRADAGNKWAVGRGWEEHGRVGRGNAQRVD